MPELPYGPEVSWPSGFRRAEFDSGEYRQLVDDYQGHNGRAPRSANRYQSAGEDYGYGDPGYADPRYDGPRDRYATGPMPAADHVYPVTGAQEVLRDYYTPPPSHGERRVADGRYEELRYDEPGYGKAQHDERLSDEAWYAELRRGEPAFPPPPGPGARQERRPSYGGAPAGYRPDGGQRGHADGRPRGDRGPRPAGQYLAAPVAQVGVLAPSAAPRMEPMRVEAPRVDSGRASTGRAQAMRVETLDTYWQGEQADYSTLLEDLAAEPASAVQPAPARRSAGRRRGRSSDHRLWIGLVGVVAVAAGAIFGILKLTAPHNNGPAHTLAMPQRVGIFGQDQNLGMKLGLPQFTQRFAQLGHFTDTMSGAFATAKTTAGLPSSEMLVIEGHLANDNAADSMREFVKSYPGAVAVPAGPLGGDAACVEMNTAKGPMAVCAWFDNDTIGMVMSPTMAAHDLAISMPSFRSAVEVSAT
ncbi:MAG TPA: hypothetical protein VKU39_07015, partial [Streptosporangiaceae bacterium]|nr:hypothetical protein [Streptosporangiaceae bacterium]